MQLKKSSKKNTKNAPETPVAAAAANDTAAKPRAAAMSSKSKSDMAETSAVKRHRKAASPVSEESKPVKATAAAAPIEVEAVEVVSAAVMEAPAPVAASEPETAELLIVVADDPSHEQIAVLAHALWMDRGCEHGCAEQDWLRAEEKLKASTSNV